MTKAANRSQWFFIRGLARQSGHWGTFPAEFEARVKGAKVYGLDLPGAGVNFAMRSPIKIRDIARFAREQYLELLDPSVPSYILATSLGAMVAVDWVTQKPEGIAGLVLLNTSFSGFSPFYHRMRPVSFPFLMYAVAREDAFIRERKVLELVSHRHDLYDSVAREWADLHNKYPMSRENLFRQLLAASSFHAPEQKPDVDVLLLKSSGDRLVNPKSTDAIQSAWQCPLITHPTAGHDIALDDPKWVIDQVVKHYFG